MSPSVFYLRDRPKRRDPHHNCSCSNRDFDVDKTLMPVFVSDPAGTAVRLRELYRDRVRGALNVELQNYLHILLELLAFPRDGILTFPYDDNVIPEIDRTRVLRVIEEYQIPSFLVEVLSHDDFWREKLVSFNSPVQKHLTHVIPSPDLRRQCARHNLPRLRHFLAQPIGS